MTLPPLPWRGGRCVTPGCRRPELGDTPVGYLPRCLAHALEVAAGAVVAAGRVRAFCVALEREARDV